MQKRLAPFCPDLRYSPIVCLLLLLAMGDYSQAAALHPKPHESYEIKDGRIQFRRGNAGIMLEVATSAMIEKYFSDRGVTITNPFNRIIEGMTNPTVFLVTLFNRTNGSLTFTPRYVIAKIKTDAYFPLDYLSMMEVVEAEAQDSRKILEKSIYHSPELIHPGKVVSKFLIFPELPKKYDDLKLQFDYLYFENAEIKTEFLFTTKEID